MFTYVIEHMEEDEQDKTSSLPRWVLLEYSQMLKLAGGGSKVLFTHLSESSCTALDRALDGGYSRDSREESCSDESKQRSSLASSESHTASVLSLMESRNIPLHRVCLLDPKAKQELTPEDGDGTFDWFLFGGILGQFYSSWTVSPQHTLTGSLDWLPKGDDPPRDRTGELRALGFPNRHLGPVQMTTDTALGVTKLVVENKNHLREIYYVDHPTIHFSKTESVEMPFRYIAHDGEPVLPAGMKQHLYDDLNRGFDD